MKSTRTLRFTVRRLFVLTIVSFLAVAALLGVAASANKANRAAKARAEQAASTKSAISPGALNDKHPNVPSAAVITATLTDNVTAATKVAPGGTINYTAVITNNGAASPADDATNLNYSDTLDPNTTLVAGSVHASPIAFNDTYNWVGNTFLDTAARALPAVTANDVAVNAPAGTDTFTVTAIAGGATALGGVVTLASPSGAFTYTPPLGRPNLADGASVNDSFTYTITNNADPSLTSIGTVTIVLTGRVWYLQAGAAGDGRSNTPSSSPSAMSTAADKSTDFFYIFSNAASLNGPFTVDAGQQLLGQGVNLVVSAITLFNSAAPTPTTTNTAGSCVSLAGAPGNNTVSGFNIGNCTGGTAITGANVGTLNVSTLSINTNGGGLDLTGVGAPTVSIVLGGLSSSGGTRNVNLIGLNGTITLASGALSGATGNAFHADGGNAGITYSGTISNSGGRQVNIINKNGGTVDLSGAVSGTGTGIFLNNNGGGTGTTINFTGGVNLSTTTNDAFTATGGGTVSVTGGANTLATTSGVALNVANTTIGASDLTFRSISAGTGAGSAGNGITLDNTGAVGNLVVTGNGGTCSSAATCTGGTIQHKTGSDGSTTQGIGIYLNNTRDVSLTKMQFNDFDNFGIFGNNVTNLTLNDVNMDGSLGNGAAATNEGGMRFINLLGNALVQDSSISNTNAAGGAVVTFAVSNSTGTLTLLDIQNTTIANFNASATGNDALFFGSPASAASTVMNLTLNNSTLAAARQFNFQLNVQGVTTSNITLTNNTIHNNISAIVGAGGGSNMTAGSAGGNIYVKYLIQNNTFRVSNSSGAVGPTNAGRSLTIGGASSNCTFDGKVLNNTFGVNGVARSGAGNAADALGIFVSGNNGSNGTNRHLIQGNTIQNYGEVGILFNARQGSGTMDATVLGNIIRQPGPAAQGAFGAIWVNSGALPADTNIVNIAIGSAGTPADKNTMQDSDPSNATDVFLDKNTCAGCASQLRLYQNGSDAAGATTEDKARDVLVDDNNPVLDLLAGFTNGSAITFVPGLPTQPTLPQPIDEDVRVPSQLKTELAKTPITAPPLTQVSSKAGITSVLAKATPKASAAEVARIYRSERPLSHHAVRRTFDQKPNAPASGETVTLNTIATFPAGGKSITVKYSATVNAPPLARQVSTQGTVTANGGINVLTDDPEPGGGADPTVTLVDTLMTWNGATSSDWNTATNWTPPAGGTQYAPGVSNPGVNDVVIPNVGNQPNISATDIDIFSLNLSNGRTLTINSGRTLNIDGAAAGSNLTLDGIISGGALNFAGAGPHVITNAGGTGSLSSTNVMTLLSPASVTLNHDLQAGAVAVNGGATFNITNRTLSLNGSGAALAVGGTLTTTGSTIVFNGTAAQTAAGAAYNNLTINNTIGLNVTGVTLTGNATVNGTLTLTSSDLSTGAFTLTQPNTTASVGVSDVVGTVTRTGAPLPAATVLTYGNPNNQLTLSAAGTKPTSLTVVIAKAAPANPNGYAAAVQRTYTVSQIGGSGFTSTVRFHYLDTELNGNTEAGLNLRRLRTSDNHWVAALPTTRDTVANWVETTGVLATDLVTRWTMSSLAPTASNGVVSGRIVDNHGAPVEGAVVRLAGTQNRKFITDANGFYRFDDVETGGFYTVTPSRVNYTFNPAAQSFSQIGETTEAAFSATLASGNFRNPLDTPEYFVRQHYLDFLGREPDERGFNFWSDQIIGCGNDQECISVKRENVSAAYFISIEFQKTGGLVDRLYRASYGRQSQFAEFMPDTRAVGLGVRVGEEGWEAKLLANKEAFLNAFVNRPAFHAVYDGMDNSLFVDTLIGHTGVSFTSGERDALVSSLANGTQTRADVLRSIAEDGRFVNAKFNEAFVMMEYFGYLRRDADASGFAFWLNKLNQFGGNFQQAEMVKAFIVSGEYRDRFPR